MSVPATKEELAALSRHLAMAVNNGRAIIGAHLVAMGFVSALLYFGAFGQRVALWVAAAIGLSGAGNLLFFALLFRRARADLAAGVVDEERVAEGGRTLLRRRFPRTKALAGEVVLRDDQPDQ